MKAVRELIALAGLVVAIWVVGDFYSQLPERIATHFNAEGMANGFGERSTLWILVGIACLLYATLSVIDFLPRVVNLRKPLDPAREKIVWDETTAMVGWVKVEVCWMFAYLCLAMVRNAMGMQVGLGRWFLPVMLLAVFGTMAVYLGKIVRAVAGL